MYSHLGNWHINSLCFIVDHINILLQFTHCVDSIDLVTVDTVTEYRHWADLISAPVMVHYWKLVKLRQWLLPKIGGMPALIYIVGILYIILYIILHTYMYVCNVIMYNAIIYMSYTHEHELYVCMFVCTVLAVMYELKSKR